MLSFNYYMSRLISKMRVPAIKNSSIDDNAFVDSGCVIIDSSLGRYSYLNENCNIFGARIGSFTSIGSNCQMGGGKHSTVFASTSPVFSDGNNCFHKSFSKNRWDKADEVVIGNDVWIGTGCYYWCACCRYA